MGPSKTPDGVSLQAIFDTAPGFLAYLSGSDLTLQYANKAYLELLERSDVIGKTAREVTPEAEEQGFLQLLKDVYASGKPYIGNEIPAYLNQKDGTRKNIYVNFVFQPLLGADGKSRGIVVQGFNVTDTMSERLKLEQSAGRFENFVNAIPQKVWSARPDGYRDFFNKRWYDFTGVAHGSTDGDRWIEVIHPDDRVRAMTSWQSALVKGDKHEAEVRLKDRQGKYHWALVRALPMRDASGEIVRWMGSYTDIQAQKDAEEGLRSVNENLERMVQERTRALTALNEELESFSYSVSHDLRTPLRSIEGFSQAIADDEIDRLSERGKKDLHRIIEASQRMAGLIDDILTLSRLTRKEMTHKPVDLTKVADQIVRRLKDTSPDRQVEVIIEPAPLVEGDQGLLEAALENLLANAWKFTSNREVAKITFGMKSVEGKPTFYVQDNGAGFDMAFYEKLFGAFQRLHKTIEFSGTGVGLALVRRIINRHGGEVWAEGRVNEGATFYFRLPLAK